MYGLLIEATVEFIKSKYGNNVWELVRKKAKINNQVFSTHQQYSETLIQRIVKHLADITGQSIDMIMDMLGVEFVNFVAQYGYDRILRVLGRHMRDFLNGLDNLHEYMRFSYAKLRPPSFFVEQESASGLVLHYRSKRKGFVHYVKGQIRQVGKIFYNINVDIEILSEKVEMELTHVVFQLNFQNTQYQNMASSTATSDLYIQNSSAISIPIRSEIFFELFPFHIVFKRNLEIMSIGDSLKQAMKNTEGESITDVFNLVRPLMSFNWQNVTGHTNNVFELTTIEPVRRSDSPSGLLSAKESGDDECLRLRGQMMYISEWDAMIFLATPVLENLDVMFQTGFYINDLSMHDSSRDLVLVGTQQSAELKLALDQEKQKSKALEDSMKKLDIEMKRTDQLLYQMIPKKIADRLRSGEQVMNLCEVFNNCTILFSDVVGFTSTCSQLAPMEVVSMLNEMYTKFDKCLELHNVYKVETIGDAYMVVSGLPERNPNHAIEIIDMGFDMLAAISTLKNPATQETMMIRIGCHSGPTVAGVVGLKMPRYCLFGDAVNTASRMESTSEAMRIHISESTKTLIESQPYEIVERGKLEVKGKGEMKTYFVLSKRDARGEPVKCPFMEIFMEQKEKRSEINYSKTEMNDDRKNSVPDPNLNTDLLDETKSIQSRGYSPVTMEDVRKSKVSLKDSTINVKNAPLENKSLTNMRKIKQVEKKAESFDSGKFKNDAIFVNEGKKTDFNKPNIPNISIRAQQMSNDNITQKKTGEYNNAYNNKPSVTVSRNPVAETNYKCPEVAKPNYPAQPVQPVATKQTPPPQQNYYQQPQTPASKKSNDVNTVNGGYNFESHFVPIQNQVINENDFTTFSKPQPQSPQQQQQMQQHYFQQQQIDFQRKTNFNEANNNFTFTTNQNSFQPTNSTSASNTAKSVQQPVSTQKTLQHQQISTSTSQQQNDKSSKKFTLKSLTCSLV